MLLCIYDLTRVKVNFGRILERYFAKIGKIKCNTKKGWVCLSLAQIAANQATQHGLLGCNECTSGRLDVQTIALVHRGRHLRSGRDQVRQVGLE